MHTDHAALFRWLVERIPGGRLYGPYDHAGRRYYQWMVRGTYLRDELVPLLDEYLVPALSERAFARFSAMKARYFGGRTPAQTTTRYTPPATA